MEHDAELCVSHASLRSDRSDTALDRHMVKVKKVKVGFLYSATYTVNHRDQPRFTILQVAVDWQKPMVLQRKLQTSIARVNVQLDPWHAASKHTTAPINHTRPSPRKLSPDGDARARKHTFDYSLLLSLSTSKGWKAESTWVAGYIPK